MTTAGRGRSGMLARRSGPTSDLAARGDNLPSPVDLVGLGFRGWVCGYRTGDLGCWERVWSLYSSVLEPKPAEAAVQCLGAWVKALRGASRHDLEVQPLDAGDFCRDECLAISMIAACQHNTCPAMRACAFALIDTALVEEVLHHTGTYALTLRSLDKVVPPQWIVNANAFIDAAPVRLH